jgi:hypothetical protein
MRHLLSLGLALALSLAAQAQSVSVRVVDAATGGAVEGADVRAVVVKHVEERRRERIPLSEIAEWEAEREATKLRAVSDASGAAKIDFSAIGVPESYVLLSARSGEQWGGRVIVGTGEGEVELRVEPDFSFDVHVFDASGKPAAGVPVAYVFAQPPQSRGMPRMPMANVTSDSNGVARFPHAQAVLPTLASGAPVLWAAIPTAEALEIPIDPSKRPQPRLELRLPPCGSLNVEFAKDFVGQVRVRAASSQNRGREDHWMSMDPWRVAVRDGVARFPYVEPGLRLDCQVEVPGVAHSMTDHIAGPAKAGETLVVRPGKRPEARLVMAQLVDAKREPLRERKCSLTVISHWRRAGGGGASSRGDGATTDSEGRVEIRLPPEEGNQIELHFQLGDVGEWVGLVPKLGDGEKLDLGVLVLAPFGDPEYAKGFDDDALEREFVRIEEISKVTSSAHGSLEALATEMVRRGGERWVALLRSRLDADRAAEREERYADKTLHELTWLILLRRAQRRPDPCRLEIHPDDLKRPYFTPAVRVRMAIRNVDPEESFETGTDGHSNVYAAFDSDSTGVRPMLRSDLPIPGGMSERYRLLPGEQSAEKRNMGWWDIDLSMRFDLHEGDWVLRLEYEPSFCFGFDVTPHGAKVAAEPFVLRVREPKK